MFIKKDLRKIPDILASADDKENANEILDLRLQRRKAEFAGSVKILCQPSHAPALSNLKSLSLYECEVSNIDGIGMLTSLECLSLGRNPLSKIPQELSQLKQLKELWLDDCQIKGTFPEPILDLQNLEELRMSNNQIDTLPESISKVTKLRVLSLDRNRLKQLPDTLQFLSRLEALLLRHNELTELPEGVPGVMMTSLKLLHVSSNQLTALPFSLTECTSITHLYLNGNQIEALPESIDLITSPSYSLKHCNLANNKLESLPAWGEFDADGFIQLKEGCQINVRDNPVWKRHFSTPRNKRNSGVC